MSITQDPTGELPAIGDTGEHRRIGSPAALVLAGGHLHVHTEGGATVVALDGGLDAELTDDIATTFRHLAADAFAVVVDLDRATLLNPTGVGSLLDLAPDHEIAGSICVVAGRLSSRLVLDRWGVGRRVAIFGTVADALQARAFSDAGYGTGWTPAR